MKTAELIPLYRAFSPSGSLHAIPDSELYTTEYVDTIDLKCVSKVLGQLSDSRTSYIVSVTSSASANNFLS